MSLDWLTARPIAHRGLHDLNRTCWENTAAAFKAAAAKNYTIECDVRMTRDSVPVVFNDSTLERLAGRRERIIDLRVKEVCALTIGNSGEAIITLEEMLSVVDGKVPLIIDLKGSSQDLDAGLVTIACDLLRHYGNKSAIASIDHHLLRRLPISGETEPHGMVCDGIQRRDIEAHFSMLAHDVQFAAFNVHQLPNTFARFTRKRLNMPILAWTVRSNDEWQRAKAYADQMIFEGFDPDTEIEPPSE